MTGRRWFARAGLSVAEHLEAKASRGARNEARVRLTVVYLRWDEPSGSGSFADLDRLVACLDGVSARRVIVDNAVTGDTVSHRDDGLVMVSGDNRAREFSGWRRGIDVADASGEATDVWLLANDRFDASPYPFLGRLTTGAIQVVHAVQAVAGRLDYYPGRVQSFGLDVSPWVNTAFFLVPDAVLRRVGGPVLVGPEDLDRIMPATAPTSGSPFVPDGPVGPLHARYLTAFLGHEPDAPHGAHWYRRLEPTASAWPEYRGKVMSILNEQLFSARARAAGVPLLELGLATRLGAMGVHNPAVRPALARLAQQPATESLRLNRVADRILLATRALVAASVRRPAATQMPPGAGRR